MTKAIMTRGLVVAAALCAGIALAAPSEAALTDVNGYVCSTTYTKQNNRWYGNGWVRITLYAEPFCAGAFVAHTYVQGPGAELPGFQHELAERLALFERAHEAALAGKRASFFVDMPQGGIFHTTYSGN